ncbi:glutathione S-transferase family protein [Paraglaciecola sp. 20A4]|uniref:glutathione S-transferase N-terminal domain-containing protein n=1 Tax=Paraglaciecola sp. 20A4 TaxID=2687288 RepID=UPI00140CA693|nr:glutathione S-transferase family protein [Paraglaciecola sp. 20A4]
MSQYSLFGSQASLFTGKARGYLRWKKLDFVEHAVTKKIMEEVILPNVGWPVIPVLQLPNGQIVQDTVDIIAHVENVTTGPSVMPKGPIQQLVSLLLQLYADEWLTIPAMHYRWNYNEEWIYSEFGRSSAPDASPEEQYRLGKERGQHFRGFVPLMGINEDTIPGIERAYESFLTDFSKHLEQHRYILGDRPSLADFALLGPLYAHLYRDPASGEIMKRLAPRVAQWTERTIAGGTAEDGLLVNADIIPETLIPILTRHMEEHLPVLTEMNNMLAKWAISAEPDEELPRRFEMTPFTTGGSSGMCMSKSFSLLRLQAVLDCIAELPEQSRAAANELLTKIGGAALLEFKLSHRLERRDCLLKLANP